jgi:hypothetical protein
MGFQGNIDLIEVKITNNLENLSSSDIPIESDLFMTHPHTWTAKSCRQARCTVHKGTVSGPLPLFLGERWTQCESSLYLAFTGNLREYHLGVEVNLCSNGNRNGTVKRHEI